MYSYFHIQILLLLVGTIGITLGKWRSLRATTLHAPNATDDWVHYWRLFMQSNLADDDYLYRFVALDLGVPCYNFDPWYDDVNESLFGKTEKCYKNIISQESSTSLRT